MGDNETLKMAILETLSGILSSDANLRNAAERQLKTLEVTEEYGVHLAELTINADGPLAIRQLSSVLLKQYVETHWTSVSEKFANPEVTDEAKSSIRSMLICGLSESISKVRTSVAYVISAIATWDWPEKWPQLFQILMQALQSSNLHQVHGAMRVLTEFCREITSPQLNQIVPVVFPEICKIFQQDQCYGVRTRSRAVTIFDTCLNLIAQSGEENKSLVKNFLFPILPNFIELFLIGLRTPNGLSSDCGIKFEIIKALTTLLKFFPNQTNKSIQPILEAVWHVLTSTAQMYVNVNVNALEERDEPVDSDGESLGFENLIQSLFDLIHVLLEVPLFRSKVKRSTQQLFSYIIIYMQITEDQIQHWTSDPDKFVEDEDEESYNYSVRLSANELLVALFDNFPKTCSETLYLAVVQHIQTADQRRLSSDPNWWKLYEGVMLAMGSACNSICNLLEEKKLSYNISNFLQQVVLPCLDQPGVSPFLIGRCLCIGSQYASCMQPLLLHKLVEATVTGMDPCQHVCLRILATSMTCKFCQNTTIACAAILEIRHVFKRMVDAILQMATQFSANVLNLCLKTLAVIIQVEPQFTSSIEPELSNLVIAVFLRYSSDPIVVELCVEMFKTLAENTFCITSLQQRLSPTLQTILQSPIDKIPYGIQSVSLEILTSLIRNSAKPLDPSIIDQLFPAAYKCTLQTDDNSTIQSGGECMRAFVSVALDQLIAWRDPNGFNGVYYVVQVVSKLLDPKTSEFTATFVGRLVSLLINKMGTALGDDLATLLRAVLSKLQQAETSTVIQSLVLVFARLLESQLTSVIEFLCSVPSPNGVSALEFVLTEWCAKQHLFIGEYDRKVSSVALCKLIEYSIASNDQRLQLIQVQGEQVIDLNSSKIRTRSKASLTQDKWTVVPLLVKVYKLLVNELSNQMEVNMSNKAGGEEESDDEEEGESTIDKDDNNDDESGMEGDDGADDTNQANYSNCLTDFQEYETDGEDKVEDDPDALSDPINQIDLQQYLTEFFKTLSRQQCYSIFSSHHNQSERKVLQLIGINV